MKRIIFFDLVVMLVIFLGLKFIPFKKTTYKSKQTDVNLRIPGFSFFNKECCMTSVTFTSPRSALFLQAELNDIMSKYESYTCNNNKYYYDEKEDITISEYGVELGFLFNTFYITYDKGKRNASDCSVINDPTKLTYQIDYRAKNGYGICYIPEKFTYKNENGEIYNVYYECIGDLLFQTGLGKMNFLNSMLSYEWISMEDVINYLEYEVKNSNFTKNTYEKNILYKNKDFSLLQCDTTDKDIYISSPDFVYKEDYCK